MLKNCNVGIGITTPGARLDVAGEILAAEGIPNPACPAPVGGYSFEGDGCYDTGMFSPSDGDLRFYANGQYALQISATTLIGQGDITTTCGASLNALSGCSDIRYKKDILSFGNVLTDVLKLQAVKYNWRQNEFPDLHFNDRRQIGFIAQDMEKIFPEIVNTNDKGYKSIDYSKLTPVLVEAIKEQQKQIDELKALVGKLIQDKATALK